MTLNEYSHPDAATVMPVQVRRPSPRHFRLQTILVPLAFLVLHWLILNLTALVYVMVYILLGNAGSNLDLTVLLTDTELLQQILMEQFPIITVIYAALLIPVYALYLKRHRNRDSRQLLLEKPRSSHILLALVMIIGTLGVTSLWFSLLEGLSETVPLIGELMDNYLELAGAFTPNVGYFWLILGISVMAPVVEELLFRGIIQGELRKAMPDWLAIIIQAVVFALFHLEPIQSSYVLLPGLLLGLAYYWSRSIWVPVIMHISFNFIGSVLPALFGENEALSQGLLWTEVAFILLGIIAAVFFYKNRRREPALTMLEYGNSMNGV